MSRFRSNKLSGNGSLRSGRIIPPQGEDCLFQPGIRNRQVDGDTRASAASVFFFLSGAAAPFPVCLSFFYVAVIQLDTAATLRKYEIISPTQFSTFDGNEINALRIEKSAREINFHVSEIRGDAILYF